MLIQNALSLGTVVIIEAVLSLFILKAYPQRGARRCTRIVLENNLALKSNDHKNSQWKLEIGSNVDQENLVK